MASQRKSTRTTRSRRSTLESTHSVFVHVPDNAHRVGWRNRPDKKNHNLCNAEIQRQRNSRSAKKGNIGFKPTREHNFLTTFHRKRVAKSNPRKERTSSRQSQNSVTRSPRFKRLRAWSESRGGLRYPLIVQDENTNLIQGYRNMSENVAKTALCVQSRTAFLLLNGSLVDPEL